MFTGIITDMGEVVSIDKQGDWKIRIRTKFNITEIPMGASIACSGVCLTVIEKGADDFLVQVSQETLNKTAIEQWQVGTKINLEQSLKMGDELGGHLVFGHVDGLAEVVNITKVLDSHEIIVELPHHLQHLAAAKGSIALDGTSLTVNDVKDNQIFLNIIPHTWEVTSFGSLQVGQKLHVEADMLARYVMRGLTEILHHNRHAQMAKDWEESLMRRFLIALIIYVASAAILFVIGADGAFAVATIPVIGYLFSTLFLPTIRKKYIASLIHKGNVI